METSKSNLIELLNKDELFQLAVILELKDLQSLCRVSKKLNQMICENDAIWLAKLKRDYPDYVLEGTPRETYLTYNRFNYQTTKLPPIGAPVKTDRAALAKLFGKK